jgi:ankyrin repeat protein
MSQPLTIDRLLNLASESPDAVLTHLREHPQLAGQQDSHGYSLLHAATSYGHIQLATALIKDFGIDANIRDEDDETALFNAETVEMAKELLVLGVSIDAKNGEGQTAAEKLADEDEEPMVAAFLRQAAGGCFDHRANRWCRRLGYRSGRCKWCPCAAASARPRQGQRRYYGCWRSRRGA